MRKIYLFVFCLFGFISLRAQEITPNREYVCPGEIVTYTFYHSSDNTCTWFEWHVSGGTFVDYNNSNYANTEVKSVKVKWDPNPSGSTTAYLRVYASSCLNPNSYYGTSQESSFRRLSSQGLFYNDEYKGLSPGSVTIPTGNQTFKLKVEESASAESYEWTLPDGFSYARVRSSSEREIKVTTSGAYSGNICVKAFNSTCGLESPITCIQIIRAVDKPTIAFKPSVMCSASTNTISINPVNYVTSYTWRASDGFLIKNGTQLVTSLTVPSSVTSIQIQAPTTNGGYNGNIYVKANRGSQSSPETIAAIWVGKPQMPSTTPSHSTNARVGNIIMVRATSFPGATQSSLSFFIQRGSGLRIFSTGPDWVNFEAVSEGTHTVNVRSSNSCGVSTSHQILVNVTANGDCGHYPNPPCHPMSVYPNPSIDYATLSFSDSLYQSSLQNGYEIKVFNQHQREVLNVFSTKQLFEINTNSFPKGIYIINIIHGEGVLQERISVK